MNNIIRLNNEMKDTCKELGYKTVSFNEFKKIHMDESSGRDMAICHITKMERLQNGVIFTFDTGETVTALYDGAVFKNNKKSSYMQGRQRVNNIGGYNANSSTLAEFIIALQSCFIFDTFPATFKNVVVNVLDGSANEETSDKLGCKIDCSLENIEWTTMSRNSRHGQIVKKLRKNNCISYKFSSWDDQLLNISKCHDFDTLKLNIIMNHIIR